jgi:hypothetical protein
VSLKDLFDTSEVKTMDTETYVILSSREIIAPSRGDIGVTRGGEMFSLEVTRPIVKLEEAELTKKERNDIRQDPRTRAIAMPRLAVLPLQQLHNPGELKLYVHRSHHLTELVSP